MNIMKTLLATIMLVTLLGAVSAAVTGESCDVTAKLVNQDPYPAVPGDYVKLVFQVEGAGVTNANCGDITATLSPEYPFSLDPNVSSSVKIKAGTFIGQDFQSYFLAPFNVRVDKDSLDKDYPIKLVVDSSATASSENRFNVTVKDQRTDFEVSIKDYSYTTGTMIFEILNIGKYNAEAVTVDIASQDNIQIKGSKRNIVGSLDANEDTTFDFEAIPTDGPITMTITYTDNNNVRRNIEKQVQFDSSYFNNRVADQKTGTSWYVYVIAIIVIIIGFFWWRRRSSARKK